jgi:hypothetical protein
MKFLLEEFRAANGVTQIFGGVAMRGDLQANGVALE